MVGDLGRKSCLMLRNHGLLTVGRSVAEAFQLMYTFERACAIQVQAQAGGGPVVPIPEALIKKGNEQARSVAKGLSPQTLLWPALLRRLDRIDGSYRD